MRALVGGAIGTSLVFALSVPAFAANTIIVTDPVGDAAYNAPGYMDIVSAQLADTGGTLHFQMTVAEAIPAAPALPPPATKQISWSWPLDTDPTTFPAGAPRAPGTGNGANAELIVTIAWDGSAFSAFLQDRRPLLTGGQATLTPLGFTISGALLRVDVQRSALGNPLSFSWGGVAFYWSAPFDSNDGNHFVDVLEPFYTPAPS
jgi:hypothetical protein